LARRPLRLRLHARGDFLDRALQLRIGPLRQLRRIFVDRDVGIDAVPLANHVPVASNMRKVGTVTLPPWARSWSPLMPIRPPQVRVPISGPSPASRK